MLQRIRESAIMFASLQQLIADRETQKTSLADAERKLKEAERQLEEARSRLARIPPAPIPAPVPPTVPTPPQGQDDSALAEALAALKQAEEAKESSRAFVDKQRAELEQMDKQYDQTTKDLRQCMDGGSDVGTPG